MQINNLDEMPWEEYQSPKGRFHGYRKNLSLALGGIRDVGEWGGGHPFDVEVFRIPPGSTNFPFHAHSAQWEFYLVKSGSGILRFEDGETTLKPGDSFIYPPGGAHQIYNSSSEDLLLLVVADQPRADVIHYPDTGHWCVKPQRKFFTMNEKEMFGGEE
jgi:uncharacterized cupin superfamily protein